MRLHVGSEGMSKSRPTKGITRTPASLSPPAIGSPRHRDGTIEQGHDLEMIVVGNEPAVSGGFGSLSQTHNRKTPGSPAAPCGKGCCPHHFPPEMRTAHRLHSAHDTVNTTD